MTEQQDVADILAHPLGQVRMVPVDRIKPYENNPRKISAKAVEQVAASIQEFGWQQSLVVDGNGVIIIGHTRRQAAIKLGLTEVPVIVETRLSEEQTRALRIADNRTRDYTQWNYPLLQSETEGLDSYLSLDLADWEPLIAGFEDSQEALLELDGDTDQLIKDTYVLSCTFATREDAELAAPEIIKLQGAVNVRYSG